MEASRGASGKPSLAQLGVGAQPGLEIFHIQEIHGVHTSQQSQASTASTVRAGRCPLPSVFSATASQ